MRIAVDATALSANWGGIPKYVDRIVGGLVEAGDRVDLLANQRRLHHLIPGASDAGLRVKGLTLWREGAVPTWLARHRPDVLWAPAGQLPRLVPVPAVVTLHDLGPVLLPGIKPPEETRAFMKAVRRSARQAERVIAVSRTTADDAARMWGVERSALRVVPLGVDERFTRGDRAAAQRLVRQRWGLEPPFVLAVGALEPRKGLDVLVAAAVEAAACGRSWRVALAGRPGYRGEDIARAAREAGCVVLGGVEEEELVALYRAAEALATPSLYEGFGLTPLEAMACGTPAVIAGGAGALAEISGEAAIVVRERTPAAWFAGIERALDEREALVARASVLRYAWADAVAGTREVLAEAAARRCSALVAPRPLEEGK